MLDRPWRSGALAACVAALAVGCSGAAQAAPADQVRSILTKGRWQEVGRASAMPDAKTYHSGHTCRTPTIWTFGGSKVSEENKDCKIRKEHRWEVGQVTEGDVKIAIDGRTWKVIFSKDGIILRDPIKDSKSNLLEEIALKHVK